MGLPKKTKKQVVVGTEKYVNQNTGEVEEFTVISKPVSKDFNFHKVWLSDILSVLDTFGTARLKVLTHLLKRMRAEDNSISGSYRELAADMGISYPTVAVTMKELIEAKVIKKIGTATYQFNPDLIMKGGSDKRKNLIIQYHFNDEVKPDYSETAKVVGEAAKVLGMENKKTSLENQSEINLEE
jgi:hypothetical protein